MTRNAIRGLALGATATATLLAAASAGATNYRADLTSINGVGIGAAALTLDGNMLTVNIAASGLDAGTHLAHIHGTFSANGVPTDSILPDIGDDMDGDGWIELAEAFPDYGPIILNMEAISDGTNISFTQTFDLTDPSVFGFVDGDPNNPKYTMEDLIGMNGMSLDLREIIIHGQNVPAVGGGTPGEVDGTAGFKVLLPTLGGEITMAAVPEAGTWAMMIGGFALLGGVQRRQRRRVAFS